MSRPRLFPRLAVLFCLLLAPWTALAQFKEEAFSQNYNTDGTAPQDSVEALFSLKQYFRGLGHKEELRIGNMFGGSAVFIGGEQIYNKQYWKLPIIYTSIAGTAGTGWYYHNRYQKSLIEGPDGIVTPDQTAKTLSTVFFAAAGAAYWGTLMDGVVNYDSQGKHMAGKATIYSILCPGLGQIYNGEVWKVPIYLGCMMGGYYYYSTMSMNYKRFKRIYIEANTNDGSYTESISADTALYYRDIYRRYRDYSSLAMAVFYLLQVIDANVFAYMLDFDVSQDLSMDFRPTVVMPDVQLASSSTFSPGVGMSLSLRF